MSIQQWSPTVRDDDGPEMYEDDNGSYVYYDDHVAEVERAERVTRERVVQVTARAEHVAAEAMRAACIEAIEAECRVRGIPAAPLTLDLLAVLREVQP